MCFYSCTAPNRSLGDVIIYFFVKCILQANLAKRLSENPQLFIKLPVSSCNVVIGFYGIGWIQSVQNNQRPIIHLKICYVGLGGLCGLFFSEFWVAGMCNMPAKVWGMCPLANPTVIVRGSPHSVIILSLKNVSQN